MMKNLRGCHKVRGLFISKVTKATAREAYFIKARPTPMILPGCQKLEAAYLI